MPLKLSFVVLLSVLALGLSEKSLGADGSGSTDLLKSSSPSPFPGQQQEAKPNPQAKQTQQKPPPPSDTKQTQQRPPPPPEPITPKGEPPSDTKKDGPKNESQEGLSWESIPDWVLVVIGIITVFLTWKIWRNSQVQTVANRDAAKAALKTEESLTTSERAYVKISHFPPGVKITANGFLVVDIEVKNHGRTPATVTDVFIDAILRPYDEQVPENPDYNIGQREFIPKGFLVADDYFVIHEKPLHLTGQALEDAKSGAKRLLVFGYVDYIDTFDQRHRAGYGREYRPDITGNNLFIISEPGYNYDRLRQPG